MRVVYLNTSSLPSNQPGPLQTLRTANAIAQTGVPVHLAFRGSRESDPDEICDYYGIEQHEELHLHPLPFLELGWLPGPLRSKLKWVSFLVVGALFTLRFARHDDVVYYARDSLPGIWLGTLARLSGSRFVFELHALPGAFHRHWPEITGDEPLPDWKIRLEEWKAETALGLADGLVAIAENLVEDLEARYELPPTVVAHDAASETLIESARGQEDDESDGILVGYIGSRFTEMRNVESILDALAELPADYRGLIIGGRDDDIERLRDRMAELEIEDNVTLTGYLPQSDALDRLQEADIVVFPYRETAARTNRSPLKLFDYMGSGAAIVASDIRPAREIFDEETAAFFDPENPEALGRTIRELGENPSRRAQMAARAAETLERHTWANRGRRIRSFLEDVVAGRAS